MVDKVDFSMTRDPLKIIEIVEKFRRNNRNGWMTSKKICLAEDVINTLLLNGSCDLMDAAKIGMMVCLENED